MVQKLFLTITVFTIAFLFFFMKKRPGAVLTSGEEESIAETIADKSGVSKQKRRSSGKIHNSAVDVMVRYGKNDLLIKHEKDVFNAEAGDVIMKGDHILTRPNSIGTLTFGKHSMALLFPNTDIVLKNFKRPSENDSGLHIYHLVLKKGGLLINFDNSNGTEQMEIQTDNMLVQVRGTRFYTYFRPDRLESGVAVQEGVVKVTDLDEGKTTFVLEQQGVIKEHKYVIDQPDYYEWVDKIDWQRFTNVSVLKGFDGQRSIDRPRPAHLRRKMEITPPSSVTRAGPINSKNAKLAADAEALLQGVAGKGKKDKRVPARAGKLGKMMNMLNDIKGSQKNRVKNMKLLDEDSL